MVYPTDNPPDPLKKTFKKNTQKTVPYTRRATRAQVGVPSKINTRTHTHTHTEKKLPTYLGSISPCIVVHTEIDCNELKSVLLINEPNCSVGYPTERKRKRKRTVIVHTKQTTKVFSYPCERCQAVKFEFDLFKENGLWLCYRCAGVPHSRCLV